MKIIHWNNSPRIDISSHSDTLSWFRANQSLLFLLNDACLAEKQQIPIYIYTWPLTFLFLYSYNHKKRRDQSFLMSPKFHSFQQYRNNKFYWWRFKNSRFTANNKHILSYKLASSTPICIRTWNYMYVCNLQLLNNVID
jgi:hypothetical protein